MRDPVRVRTHAGAFPTMLNGTVNGSLESSVFALMTEYHGVNAFVHRYVCTLCLVRRHERLRAADVLGQEFAVRADAVGNCD